MPKGIVHQQIEHLLHDAMRQARDKGQLKLASIPTITLDPPKKPEWGDLASTVAMSLASSEQRAPHDIAQIIVDNMGERDRLLDRVEIVRPGFLNMTVKKTLWLEVLREIEAQGARYGQSRLGAGQRILIEYVSANPTGPLHVGHGRGAAVGQALATLLEFAGYDVVREYYINDAGRQMKLLGASVYARVQQLTGRQATLPEDGYQGAYLEPVAASILASEGDALTAQSPAQAEQRCQDLAYAQLLEAIRVDLRRFGVEFQSWFSEASLLTSGAVERVLQELKARGLIIEQDGALWFRSSAYGDEKDRVVKKQDGDYTYLASDIAYHRDKLSRGYDRLINIWGADHHGYIPRMQGVVEAFGYPKERLQVVLVQMVNLLRGGQKVEMSKRAGTFVTLQEVLDEVGVDAAKFYFLMRRADSHVDFDLEVAKRRSADNPVYYVQYAHARISSIARVAAERGIPLPATTADADLTLLGDPDELTLLRKLALFPLVVEAAADAQEPHRITFYLQELAAQVHGYYFRHRILPPAAVGEADSEPGADPAAAELAGTLAKSDSAAPAPTRETMSPQLTAARLSLMTQVQQVIRNGLTLLGVSAPDRM